MGCPSKMLVDTKSPSRMLTSFLSETNRKRIDHRLLIATTDRLGANTKQEKQSFLDQVEQELEKWKLRGYHGG
jgi:hypothetical protein